MRLIDRQPFSEENSEVWTPDGIVLVKPFQIVVMVSLSPGDVLEPGTRRFPAILDTGLNHNFAIRRDHADHWTGLRLSTRGSVTIRKQAVPLAAAHVWLHPNQSRTTRPSSRAPFRPRTPDGIILYPEETADTVRLPTLGLRALVRTGLILTIDGRRRRFTLKAAGWL